MDTRSSTSNRAQCAVAGFGLAVALGLAAVPATAAPDHCASHEEVMTLLSEKYAEAPVARGLSLDGRMIEVLTSKDGASWSIVVSKPDKSSCIALAGEGWQGLAGPKARLVKAHQ